MSLSVNKQFNDEENLWTVQLAGEVDIYTAGQLKEAFIKMIEERKETIKIDCEELVYIDSTGLGVLIGALKRLKQEKKEIMLFNIKPSIKKLLNITGLDKIFIIEG
ncbi:anti-sigma-factor antagonist [Alkaliphilus metalliredigens QYMF]|uniref:Anti-sigma factor antagonist n=1 Tax=Alkaliphilus metalliredigens (strain QYMF) TaxID=293826 RepID=A6TJ83_ALKMQ|nr:STAS domain-containing protein [Alkaliphilus metalliredigens]ABR46251.1 anti-sigma-factor antagonist [Alkaliphilus metalliredigens QYMF]